MMIFIKSMKIRDFGGLLTLLTFFLSSCVGECPTKNDVAALNIDQFSGEWYFVAGTPAKGKVMSKCGRFVVTSTSTETFVINFTALNDNRTVAFIINAKLDDDVTGNWQLKGSNRILGPYKHRIIDVNYESYFTMIACGIDGADLPLREFAMIWSREKSLPKAILTNLKDKVGAYINRDMILEVDQSDC